MKENVRIGSIDALRGIALFCILLMHATAYFGFGRETINDMSFMSSLGHNLAAIIAWLIEGRANKVFCMLFGVSFYLILRNPTYSSLKFIWRCVLLSIIGLFNKIFFSGDALLWYGIMGVVLTLFRNLSPRSLLFAFIILFLISYFLPTYNVGDTTAYISRYNATAPFINVLRYPYDYGYGIWFSYIPIMTLAYFILGYSLAKSGVVEEMQRYITKKNIIILFFCYLATFALWVYCKEICVDEGWEFIVKPFRDFFGSFFYIILFLWIYYKFPSLSKVYKLLEAYGRLGLTNYSFQGILGVIITYYLIMPNRMSFEYALIVYLLLYVVQALFSYYWLKMFKNGPMEWLWRCLTNRKFTSPLLRY